MATKLLTNNQRLNSAEQVLESISEPANSVFYMFFGDHTQHSNAQLQPLYDNENLITYTCYQNMVFGKRVEEADVKLMIRNVPWTSNSLYSMYDDSANDLYNDDFYVIVDANSYLHVYKCLDNNQNAYSTVEPNFAHISGSNSYVYQTSDGYRWKYMYSVDSANNLKFSTSTLFPVIANASVSNAAISGAIDIIRVEGTGRGYDNYSTGTFDADDLRIGGDPLIYGMANTTASSVNGFYTGCVCYISTGTGSGQYRTVSDYYANSSGKFFEIDEAFSTNPTNGSEFQIYPEVLVTGSGTETTNAVARALVNALASNSVYRVEMFERGADYTYAIANVVANSVVQVQEVAELRPIYSPFRGHGYNAARELGAHHLCFAVKVSNTENDTVPVDNQLQQVGLLRNPLFANVVVEYDDLVGSFLVDEEVFEVTPVLLNSNATMNTTSAVISCNTADFENQVSSGEWLLLKASNNDHYQLAQVNAITNATHITITTNGAFACTSTKIMQSNVSSNAWVISPNATHVALANVSGQLGTGDMLVGCSSGAMATVNTVSRGGVIKSFDTFINMYKYVGTLSSGSFTQNETIYQGNVATANAVLHSANVDGATLTLYTTNQLGMFEVNNSVIGLTSGAVADVDEKHGPELLFGSGDILFLENINPLTRSANTNETIQFVFEY